MIAASSPAGSPQEYHDQQRTCQRGFERGPSGITTRLAELVQKSSSDAPRSFLIYACEFFAEATGGDRSMKA